MKRRDQVACQRRDRRVALGRIAGGGAAQNRFESPPLVTLAAERHRIVHD